MMNSMCMSLSKTFLVGGAQYDRSVSNGQKIIFHPLIFEYKNTTFGLFVTFYDVMDHI